MDVETTAERIVPTANFVTVAHPNMPVVDKVLQIDGSIDHKHTFEVPHEPNDLVSKSPLEFVIHPTPNYFVDLQSFTIDVKLQIRKADGSRDGRGAWTTHFINNLAQNLWSVVKVYLNDACVQSNYDNQQGSNLTHILTTPNTVVEERGVVQGVFPVTDETLVRSIDAPHAAKALIGTRIAWTRADTVHVRGPLHLDLSSCTKFLVDGVRLKLVLEPGAVAFLIKASLPVPPETYDYRLLGVKLIVTKIKPSEGALVATAKMMVGKPIEYLMRRTIMHREVIPAGYADYTTGRPFQDLIPNKLYIFMVDREAATGHQQRSPFYYDHHGLAHYSVKINGVQVAGGPTDEGTYIGEYLESHKAHAGDYFIPYGTYLKGCFVLCINTNDQSEYNSLNVEKKGNLSITLKFAAPLQRPDLLHVAGTVDSPFEVVMDRNVTTHFQH